jgi:hypothetical protein
MAARCQVEIALGPYTVKVVRDDATDLRLAEAGLSGESDVSRGLIYVRSDLDYAREREVLLHELLHHVVGFTHLAARWSDDEQEEVIRAVAPWLAMAVTLNGAV